MAWLTDELVALGRDVTLFASGGSGTRATLAPVIPQAIRLSRPHREAMAAYALELDMLIEAISQFDVVHCHIDWLHLPILARAGVPYLTTLHNRLDTPDLPELMQRFPRAPFVSISNHQRQPLPEANWLATIYHGMPCELLQPSYRAGDYLAFLGRLTRDKGPEVAIRLARAAKIPLHMAAKIPRAETRYYQDRLKPLIDGEQIWLVGEVNDEAKADLLKNAAVLLFPIDWPEPFGLVMIEAMACGTPVVAFRRGAVPEVIDEGITGFVVDTEEAAIAAIKPAASLDRRRIRATFERRFAARRMAEDYRRSYERLLGAGAVVPQRNLPCRPGTVTTPSSG